MAASTACEICGVPTNLSFKFAGKLHYFCTAHENELFEKVTGGHPSRHASRPNRHPRRNFVFELKHDGFRAVAYIEDGSCRLVSRKNIVDTSYTRVGDRDWALLMAVSVSIKIPVSVPVPAVVMFKPTTVSTPVTVKEPFSIVMRRHPASAWVWWPSPIAFMPPVVPAHWIPDYVRSRVGFSRH
jgi:hypothetical protein